jgi:hypothetical protein
MDTQTLESLEIPEDIINTLMAFSSDRSNQVFDFVRFLAQQYQTGRKQQSISAKRRIPNLDRGAVIWIDEDFNAPL